MRPARTYSTEEVAGLPSDQWVKASEYLAHVRVILSEAALMFSPHDVSRMVAERDAALKVQTVHLDALRLISEALGHPFRHQDDKHNAVDLARLAVAKIVQSRWIEIDEIHVPRLNDEVVGQNGEARSVSPLDFGLLAVDWLAQGWTHFRRLVRPRVKP